LLIASKNGYSDIVYELLRYGPDPSMLNAKKQSPLMLAKNEKVRDMLKRYMREKFSLAFN
jgi:ankyrin repeat protein